MLCMLPEESFAAAERTAPTRPVTNGPKITGDSWAARQEAKMWRELAAKKAAAR